MTQKRQGVGHVVAHPIAPPFAAAPASGPGPYPAIQRRPPAPLQSSEVRIEGVYVISVAARILEMHPQTLRKYERVGLVRPSRTMGMLRLYSDQDIARLRLIKHLVDDVGLNLAGVEFVLQVFNRMLQARSLLEAIQEEQDFAEHFHQELQRLLEILDMEQRPS